MSKDMTMPTDAQVQELQLPAPTGPIIDHTWLDEDEPMRVYSGAKIENERARAKAMQAGAGGIKNKVWHCDGEFVYFRRRLAATPQPGAPEGLNPHLVARHNKMIANGEYRHVATQDDVEIYELQEHSPFKRKGINLMTQSISQVRWIAIYAATGRYPGVAGQRDSDWGLFVDCLEEMSSRIKGMFDAGTAKMKYNEELSYTFHLLQQAGGPGQGAIDRGVADVMRRRGKTTGKMIILPT